MMATAAIEHKGLKGSAVVGHPGSDILEAVALEAMEAVKSKFKHCDRGYQVRTVRFLPETKSPLPEGSSFEILANVAVDTGGKNKFGFAPSKVYQAIIKISEKDGIQKFDKASIIID